MLKTDTFSFDGDDVFDCSVCVFPPLLITARAPCW